MKPARCDGIKNETLYDWTAEVWQMERDFAGVCNTFTCNKGGDVTMTLGVPHIEENKNWRFDGRVYDTLYDAQCARISYIYDVMRAKMMALYNKSGHITEELWDELNFELNCYLVEFALECKKKGEEYVRETKNHVEPDRV